VFGFYLNCPPLGSLELSITWSKVCIGVEWIVVKKIELFTLSDPAKGKELVE